MRMATVVDGLATVEVGNSCVLIWRAAMNAERFSLQRESMERVAHAYPGETDVLCIIEPGAEPPSPEQRVAMSALLTKLAPKLRCIAYVVEGSGFRAAAVRGVLSGIELMRRNSYTTRYFATVEQATTWMDSALSRKRIPLREAVYRLRERLDDLDGTSAKVTRPLSP